MADVVAIRCENGGCDPSALRLSVTVTAWYLLDMTPDAVYPVQPEADDDPVLQLVCLECGHEFPASPALRARLRFE